MNAYVGSYAWCYVASVMLVLFGAQAHSQTISFPYTERGACIGEACRLDIELVAKVETEALSSPNSKSGVAYQVRKNERLYVRDGVVITSRPGILNVRQYCQLDEGVTVVPGDKVLLLRYVGEGFHRAWYRGRHFDIECMMECGPKGCLEDTRSEAEYEWWLLVESTEGKTGWVRSEPFIHQGQYAKYEQEADWLVLRNGESKLGFKFDRIDGLMHKGRILSANLMPGTYKVLVSSAPPQLIITCYKMESDIPAGLNVPYINESCSLLSVRDHNCDGRGCSEMMEYWPNRRTAPYIGNDYAVFYMDPSTGDRDGLLSSGEIVFVDLDSGKSNLIPIHLAGHNERQYIDIDSFVRGQTGFMVNAYVGCDLKQPNCDGRYSKSFRLNINPQDNKTIIKAVGVVNGISYVDGGIAQNSTSVDSHVALVKVATSLDQGSSPITVDAGHAWIEITDLSSGTVETYGTWGNKSPQGLYKNTELGYVSLASRSKYVTKTEYDNVHRVIGSYLSRGESAWGPINNCTAFAKAGWMAASGENINIYTVDDLGFPRPIVPSPVSFMYSLIDLNDGYADSTINTCNSLKCASKCTPLANNCQ